MPHMVWLAPQTHAPETQVPCPQLWLHVPQWAGSAEVSKQPVGQVMSPDGHVQTPPTQLAPGLQVTAPQVTPPLELEALEVVVMPLLVDAVPLPVDDEPPEAPEPLELPLSPQPGSISQAEPLMTATSKGNRGAFRRAMVVSPRSVEWAGDGPSHDKKGRVLPAKLSEAGGRSKWMDGAA
jgi:hypothetical protein